MVVALAEIDDDANALPCSCMLLSSIIQPAGPVDVLSNAKKKKSGRSRYSGRYCERPAIFRRRATGNDEKVV